MISVTSAQLNAFLAAFLFPLVRILAWLSADPLLGNSAAPVTIRVALGFVLTVAIAPVLPPPPQVAVLSVDGLLILAQQIVVGLALGFSLRIVFAAVEFAGQFMGLQMGLSFATFYDPVNGAQTPVVAQFMVLTTVLMLFAMNGHYLVLEAVVHSFTGIPMAATPFTGYDFSAIVRWGGTIFMVGLQIALPVTAALLCTNLTIGMMTRAAPQLNILAIGFPLTLGMGFLMLYFTLDYLSPILRRLWDMALQTGIGALQAGMHP
jgi:flagellar biosynthetic protein FliR